MKHKYWWNTNINETQILRKHNLDGNKKWNNNRKKYEAKKTQKYMFFHNSLINYRVICQHSFMNNVKMAGFELLEQLLGPIRF